MKVILENRSIRLEAESFADQLYIADYLKKSRQEGENGEFKITLEPMYTYSEHRCSVGRPQGGGSLNMDRLVDELYDKNGDEYDDGKVAIEEITELVFHNCEI